MGSPQNAKANLRELTQIHEGEKMQFIDLKAQYDAHKAAIDSAIHKVLEHGHFIMGPEIAEVEAKLSEYVGVKHCLTVSSGTHSLEIALRALGVGPGDEVVTVPFTWISTSEVICLVGATPRFVDIDPVTFNMDVAKLEAAITPKTKAIMPVSLFGQMPDYRKIREIADKYEIPVIEDGAQSFGATRRDSDGIYRSCSCKHTQVASTSFFPAKPLGCYGDGGALFTNDDGLATRIKAIRTHGGERRHYHTLVGTNGRFDTIQAAVLLAKLPYFDGEVKKRAEVGARYHGMLKDFGDVMPPQVDANNTSVWAQYTIRVPVNEKKSSLVSINGHLACSNGHLVSTPFTRDVLAGKLKELGVPTAVYYPKCLHEQPVFSNLGYKWGDFPEAEKASREVLSLPMSPFLSEQDQEKVVKSIKEVING